MPVDSHATTPSSRQSSIIESLLSQYEAREIYSLQQLLLHYANTINVDTTKIDREYVVGRPAHREEVERLKKVHLYSRVSNHMKPSEFWGLIATHKPKTKHISQLTIELLAQAMEMDEQQTERLVIAVNKQMTESRHDHSRK